MNSAQRAALTTAIGLICIGMMLGLVLAGKIGLYAFGILFSAQFGLVAFCVVMQRHDTRNYLAAKAATLDAIEKRRARIEAETIMTVH